MNEDTDKSAQAQPASRFVDERFGQVSVVFDGGDAVVRWNETTTRVPRSGDGWETPSKGYPPWEREGFSVRLAVFVTHYLGEIDSPPSHRVCVAVFDPPPTVSAGGRSVCSRGPHGEACS